MTDPIADLLTRVRNAVRVRMDSCTVPGSAMKVRILDVLKREGYIRAYEVFPDGHRSHIRIDLKYGPDGEQLISSIDRYSSPGCRRHRRVVDLPKVRGGLGIAVVSTSSGVLSDRECREKNVGGEVLCTVA